MELIFNNDNCVKNILYLFYIMNINKMLKKMNATHLVMLVAAVALGYALFNYSSEKSQVRDSMENAGAITNNVPSNIANPPEAPGLDNDIDVAGNPKASQPLGENSGFASVSSATTSTHGMPPACSREQVTDPSELLPKDENSEWAKLNPMGSGDLQNVNLLKSGYHVGINTVSSSLRNANLQVRSEPANPQMSVGPWNNTTISPDNNRRPLEIGCSA